MRRLKRFLIATIAAAAVCLLIVLLATSSAIVVWFGTGADPSDAFREPELVNTSLKAALTWSDSMANGELSTREGELLADAWADGFALLERRSNGERVDLARRFHSALVASLEPPDTTGTARTEIQRHAIDIEFISTNRQVVALAVDVDIRRTFDLHTIDLVETYEAVMVNGLAGWTIVTLNRSGAEPSSERPGP